MNVCVILAVQGKFMPFNRDRNDRNRSGGDRGGFRSRPSSSYSSRNDRPSFGGDRDRNDRGPVEMHQAVCDNCGKNCEVPFKPTSGKPIFCSDCFEKQKGQDFRRGGDSPRFSPRNEGGRDFDRDSRNNDRGSASPDKFAELSAKLDKIISLLSPVVLAEEVVVSEKPVKASKKKAKVEEIVEDVAPIEENVEESAPITTE